VSFYGPDIFPDRSRKIWTVKLNSLPNWVK
jgi:hypothetical protein